VWAAVSALVFTGGLDFEVLSRSQVPFAGSLTADRLCVAACLGLGVGVTVAALALLRAERPRIEYTDDPDEGGEAVEADSAGLPGSDRDERPILPSPAAR
jgi:hypothetical protein